MRLKKEKLNEEEMWLQLPKRTEEKRQSNTDNSNKQYVNIILFRSTRDIESRV